MCKVGDIILIKNYKHNDVTLSKHSFVVLDVENDEIHSLPYDLMCNVMSSFSSDEQREKKLKYPGNFPITYSETKIQNGNNKDGYIKAEQFYYFKKDSLNYKVIGNILPETFNKLVEFINSLDVEFEHITDNLK